MSALINLKIAKTHLVSKKSQSIIAALGVTFGISMFIVMMATMMGVNQLLTNTMLESTPHIRIFKDLTTKQKQVLEKTNDNALVSISNIRPKKDQNKIKNGLKLASKLKAQDEVVAVSPNVNSQVFYNYGIHQIPGVLKGVNIIEEAVLTGIDEKIIKGKYQSLLTNKNGIIIGAGIARKLELKVGDKIKISTPKSNSKLMKIVAILKTGISQIDNGSSFANITSVQSLLGLDNSVITEINLKLTDPNIAKDISAKISKNYKVDTEDWEEANATILESNVMRNFMTYIIVGTILVVAAFGIYNIMNMTVYDKIKDIAILNTMGFEGKDLISTFIYQSLIIGFIGGFLGLIFGKFLVYLVSLIELNSDEFITLDKMPVNDDPLYYLWGMIFGLTTTFFAGFFPAWKASKIDPVEIIRGK